MIGYVAEYQTADNTAGEEGRLSRRTEKRLVANPLELTTESITNVIAIIIFTYVRN